MSEYTTFKIIFGSVLILWITIWLFIHPNVSKIQQKRNNILSVIFYPVVMLSCCKLLKFVFLWMKERRCICSVQKKNFLYVINKFCSNSKRQLLISITFFLTSLSVHLYLHSDFNYFILGTGLIIFTYYLLFQEPNKIEISSILESNNNNIGCGAARQYFHGYLKVIMSEQELSWRRRLRNYKHHHGVDIYSKLIVLLPESCQTQGLLVDREYLPEMRPASSLETVTLNLSGIKRQFHSTVYVIDERIWFVAEYPPPLNTFCKMLEYGTGQLFDAADKQEQYIMFYQELKKLIEEDGDCVDTCLLVSYNDKKEDSLSLTEMIIKRIEDDELQMGRSAG